MKKANKNNPYVPDNFPEQVRVFRIKYGLTQTRMAELMGVSFATLNRWENGQSKPSRLAWQQILRAERYGLDALSKNFEPTMTVKEPVATYETAPKKPKLPDFTSASEIVRICAPIRSKISVAFKY
jgi:transcriptional regulator with XRE-family HTH domain